MNGLEATQAYYKDRCLARRPTKRSDIYYYTCQLKKRHKGNHWCLEKSWKRRPRKRRSGKEKVE